jgi:hypothetical protein
LVLVEDVTRHIEGGWAFFVQYKKYLETGDIHDMLMGVGPVIVSSSDGTLHFTDSRRPPEYYVSNFETFGDPYGTPTE